MGIEGRGRGGESVKIWAGNCFSIENSLKMAQRYRFIYHMILFNFLQDQEISRIRLKFALFTLSSADNLCKQFGPWSAPTEWWS